MSTKITYFVHGTTTDNEKEISSGWFDIGLSDLGVKQSIDLGETGSGMLRRKQHLCGDSARLPQNHIHTKFCDAT